MDSEDGEAFLKRLAHYIRLNERSLADTPHASSRTQSRTALTVTKSVQSYHQRTSSGSSLPPPQPSSPIATYSRAPFTFRSRSYRPTLLTLTLNQIYYLLCRFEELDVDVGSMSVRLENIHAETSSSNYVSFLANNPNVRSSDHSSIHSIVDVRSVMSKMSLFMSMLSFSSHRETREARRKTALLQDLRYLYSCFTKLPCLRLVNTSGAKLICNFEEFPLDTAVPLHAFKNLTVLEICDVDFRSVYGWDRLAEQLRSLTVKRVGLISVTDLIIGIVLDDADQRRRQSCKTPTSPMHGHSSWATAGFRESIGSSQEQGGGLIHAEQTMDPLAASAVDSSVHGEISGSPERPLARSVSSSGWYGGRVTHDSNTNENPDKRSRRGSEGSTLSRLSFSTPRRSTTNLLATAFQTTSKWNFLRHLSLSDNGMTGLEEEGLRPLADILQSLDISDNLFTRIPASLGELHALRQLNVCNCMIDSLDEMSLSTLSRVAVLNLRANRLGSLIGIENVGQLERLDLRDNQLHDPTEVRRLAGSQCFHDIFVNGNPFVTSQSDYRVTIFNSFRKYSPFPHDVTVDAAGPQQHELDQLIDRTAGQSFEMASGADSGQDHTAPDKAHAVAGQRVRDVNLDGRETAGQMFPQNIHEQRMPDSHVTASVSKMHAVNEYTASPLSNASLVQPVVVGTLEAGNTGTPLSA